MKMTQAAGFCRRFGRAVYAGVDLVSIVRAEANQGPERQRQALRNVADGMAAGYPMADAMESQKFFPSLMVTMTRVGEETGNLEKTYTALADHYDNQLAVRRAFMWSIAWPAFQLLAGICIIAFVIWLLGVLTPAGGGEMYDILGWGLRGTRGVVIYFAYVGTAFGSLYLMWLGWKHNIGGVQRLIPLIYLIPRVGDALQTITMARFCWTLAMSLGSGMTPMRSARLSLDSTDSEYYREASPQIEERLQAGDTMSASLASADIFPEDFITKLSVSEISGSDSEGLHYIAADYDVRAKGAVKTISGIMTGIIWLTIAAIMIYCIYTLFKRIFIDPYNEILNDL